MLQKYFNLILILILIWLDDTLSLSNSLQYVNTYLCGEETKTTLKIYTRSNSFILITILILSIKIDCFLMIAFIFIVFFLSYMTSCMSFCLLNSS